MFISQITFPLLFDWLNLNDKDETLFFHDNVDGDSGDHNTGEDTEGKW